MDRHPVEQTRCAACGAAFGRLHHDYCDLEQCPDCCGQYIACDCGELTAEDWAVLDSLDPNPTPAMLELMGRGGRS